MFNVSTKKLLRSQNGRVKRLIKPLRHEKPPIEVPLRKQVFNIFTAGLINSQIISLLLFHRVAGFLLNALFF